MGLVYLQFTTSAETTNDNRLALQDITTSLEEAHHSLSSIGPPLQCAPQLTYNSTIQECSIYDAHHSNSLRIGSGKSGAVYKVEIKGSPFAMKEMDFRENDSEVSLLAQAAQSGLAPKIFKDYICKDRQGNLKRRILTELLDSTLEQELRAILSASKPNNEKRAQVFSLIRAAQDVLNRLHKIGIIHNDLHLENIMLTRASPDGKRSLRIIDFGSSSRELLKDSNPQKVEYIDTEMQTFFNAVIHSITELHQERADAYSSACMKAGELWKWGVCLCESARACSTIFDHLVQELLPIPAALDGQRAGLQPSG